MEFEKGRKTEQNASMGMSFQERDTAPTLGTIGGEGRSLLSTNVMPGNKPETCGNYGSLNNSRHERSDAGDQSNLDDSQSDMQSVLGESVMYHEHVSQYTIERSQQLLGQISDKITFFAMIVFVLLPTTLMANGVG